MNKTCGLYQHHKLSIQFDNLTALQTLSEFLVKENNQYLYPKH